jgi:hypothetical protein
LTYPGIPDPPLSQAVGIVLLFSGWTPYGTTNVGTGVYVLTQKLRAIGVRAEVFTPQQWGEAAAMVRDLPNARQWPIAIIGFSLGAEGATRLADALKSSAIPVQILVAIEAWHAIPVACNVRYAIDISAPDRVWSLSDRLEPGAGFTGSPERVIYSPVSADNPLGHFTMSLFDNLHELIKKQVLVGNKVARRLAPPTEAMCFASTLGARG